MDELYDYIGESPRKGQRLSIGSFTPGSQYLLPSLLSGSHYSGGTVEQSNFEAFMKMYRRRAGIHKLYGGHGTYGVAIRVPMKPDIEETINALDDYCLIDDMAHSALEWKLQQETWQEIREEVQDQVIEGIGFDLEEIEGLDELFEQARESANKEWIIETGCSVFIETEKIIPVMVDLYRKRHFKDEDLPLLLGQTINENGKKYIERRLKGMKV